MACSGVQADQGGQARSRSFAVPGPEDYLEALQTSTLDGNSNITHGYGSKADLPTGKTVLLTPHTMAFYTTIVPRVSIATHAYLFQHDDAQC